MAYRSSLYGLSVSSNLPIPGLLLRDDPGSPDVRIHLRETNETSLPIFSLHSEFFHTTSNLKANGLPVFRASRVCDGFYGFFYGDGGRFAVKSDGSEIWAEGPENYALEDTATYLVGPVMGFIVRLRGVLPLHACSVAVGDKAI